MYITEDIANELKRLRDEGTSILDICKIFDRSERTISRWLKFLGLTSPADRVDITDFAVKDAWDSGLTANEIAKMFKCSHDTVTKHLDRLGVKYDRQSGIIKHFSRTHDDLWDEIKSELDRGASPSAISEKFHMRYDNVFRLARKHGYWKRTNVDLIDLEQVFKEYEFSNTVSGKTKFKYVQNIMNYYNENDSFPTRLELANYMGLKLSAICNAVVRYDLSRFVIIGSPHVSGYAMKLQNFLDDMGIDYLSNDRKTLIKEDGHAMELDFFIPSLNIGIEVNPTATHSVDVPSYGISDKNYHQVKSLLAEKCGIGLVHMYDYDFLDNRVYNIFTNQLLCRQNDKIRIGARKCDIRDISRKESNDFLDKYHFQGKEFSSIIRKGLYHGEDLIGVLSVGEPRYTKHDYEIIRYCPHPNYIVSGLFSRLFNSFLKDIEGSSATIVSYMDMNKRFSSENIYEKFGFKLEGVTDPDYVWVTKYGGNMLSRYMTTKSKLIKQGFDRSMTEVEIMRSRGYFRIFGAGSKRYVYQYNRDSN